MAEKQKNLMMKVVEVRKEIDAFVKDTKGYRYEYVSGSQVLSKIKAKMDELYLTCTPYVNDVKDEKDGKNYVIRGDVFYVWEDAETGEQRSYPWKLYGSQDDISKAFGTALTYSERYFLLKFFGIPTDDEDPDTRQGGNRNNGSQQNKSKQTPKKASMAQREKIEMLVKEFSNLRNVQIDRVLSEVNISDLQQVTEDQAGAVIGKLGQWVKKAQEQAEKESESA